MSITFDCPDCGKAFNVADQAAGKRAICKQCGARMTVPGVSGPAFGDDDDPDDLFTASPRPAAVASSATKGVDAAKKGISGLGGLIFLLYIGLRIVGAMHLHNNRPNRPPPPPRGQINEAVIRNALNRRNALPPKPPERGESREVAPGVTVEEVRTGPPNGNAPPAHAMTFWLYLPAGEHAAKSLPCVLIAPGGTDLATGKALEKGVRPEHLPYVQQGFAVLAYSLDGDLPVSRRGDPFQRIQAMAQFVTARAGLANADAAIDWLAAKVPEVDLGRLYTAGHGSGGTMALLLAENEPRIKGCAAFEAPGDVRAWLGPNGPVYQQMFPPSADLFDRYNPGEHLDKIHCPVFLFLAEDDRVVRPHVIRDLAAWLESVGKAVTLETTKTGGHHDALIDPGIPRAIDWLKGIDAKAKAKAKAKKGDED